MDYIKPTTQHKPKPDFEIRFVGHDLRPWAVPVRVLARALTAVQRLMEPSDEERPQNDEELIQTVTNLVTPLHLIGVVSGSARYSVSANDPKRTINMLTEAGRALKNPNIEDWSIDLLAPIEELSVIARSLNCTIEFKQPGRDGEVFATIESDSYAALAATAFVTGESSIYGYLERVGGATDQRCGLRLPTQPEKMVYCTVETEELVRQLGQHIYENVFVSGIVTWFRKVWRVKHIRVTNFEPSKNGSILDTLDKIYKAGGKAWDDINDPEGFIAEMRGK